MIKWKLLHHKFYLFEEGDSFAVLSTKILKKFSKEIDLLNIQLMFPISNLVDFRFSWLLSRRLLSG